MGEPNKRVGEPKKRVGEPKNKVGEPKSNQESFISRGAKTIPGLSTLASRSVFVANTWVRSLCTRNGSQEYVHTRVYTSVDFVVGCRARPFLKDLKQRVLTAWDDCAGGNMMHWVMKELRITTKVWTLGRQTRCEQPHDFVVFCFMTIHTTQRAMCACLNNLNQSIAEVLAMSEIAKGPTMFLKQNIESEVFYSDVLIRNHKNPVPRPSEEPMWYTAGFPCKAFSSLRTAAHAFSITFIVDVFLLHTHHTHTHTLSQCDTSLHSERAGGRPPGPPPTNLRTEDKT